MPGYSSATNYVQYTSNSPFFSTSERFRYSSASEGGIHNKNAPGPADYNPPSFSI